MNVGIGWRCQGCGTDMPTVARPLRCVGCGRSDALVMVEGIAAPGPSSAPPRPDEPADPVRPGVPSEAVYLHLRDIEAHLVLVEAARPGCGDWAGVVRVMLKEIAKHVEG